MSKGVVVVAAAGEVVILLLLLADLVGGLPSGAVSAGRAVALVAAFVTAGALYQGWSVATARQPSLHVSAGVGLIAGAFVAASVFSPQEGRILGTTPFSVLGVFGLVLAVVLAQLSTRPQEKKS